VGRVKDFKEKSEKFKEMMGTGVECYEGYEAAAEELRRDEKKLGVSEYSSFFNLTQFYR